MTIRPILEYPNQALLRPSDEVTTFDDELKTLVVDLLDTATAFRAEGLAAIQIGVPKRVFIIKDNDEYLVCVNPVITSRSPETVNSNEGCLSFPTVLEFVTRSEEIEVSFADENGERCIRVFDELAAVAFQHELDHLDGILFISKMGKLQRHMALKKLEKSRRRAKKQLNNIQRLIATARM